MEGGLLQYQLLLYFLTCALKNNISASISFCHLRFLVGPGRHQEVWAVIIQTEEVFLLRNCGEIGAESDRNWLVAARMETDHMDQTRELTSDDLTRVIAACFATFPYFEQETEIKNHSGYRGGVLPWMFWRERSDKTSLARVKGLMEGQDERCERVDGRGAAQKCRGCLTLPAANPDGISRLYRDLNAQCIT